MTKARDLSKTPSGGNDFSLYEDTGTTPKFFWDASAERLILGDNTVSPAADAGDLVVGGSTGNNGITIGAATTGTGSLRFADTGGTGRGIVLYDHASDYMSFHSAGGERVRIDSSGNLLVGKTSSSFGATGIELKADNQFRVTRSGVCASLNRLSTDGTIADFYGPSGLVGGIGNAGLGIGMSTAGGWSLFLGNNAVTSRSQDFSSPLDNAKDVGASNARWDDIYATNGIIQTSDRNEKQDIEALSDAEQRVAVAAKGLLRKYRWKDAVAEKGDAARIHFGIIAQDLQAAFEAEGLDAGRYGMFISSTWWEAERVIPAVEAQDAVYETVVIPAEYDADGNEVSPETTEERLVSEAVEAQPERTVTDTYQTQEEAPEGAVERTRLGVRYPELLAFIIAAI